MPTRRDFLKSTAVLTAGAMLSKPSFAIKEERNVIIIGAGFSGLAAAYKLKQAGMNVTVLEARNRIGGRVFSHKFDNGLVIELGAEWVGASHERLIAMTKEFGLELFDNRFRSHLIYDNAYHRAEEWDYSPEWETKFAKIINDYPQLTENQKKKLDKMDWWRFLVNMGIGEKDLDLREFLDSTDFGESIRHVSAFAALAEYAESSEHNEMDFKIRGGNSRLTEELAARIGMENILTNQKVTDVIQKSTGVEVYTSSGANFKGAKLICTAPVYAVNSIRWSPGLPEEYKEALNSLQYARINKNATLFNKRFWDEDFDMVTDTTSHYFYHATKNQPGEQGVLISYSIGDKADMIQRYSRHRHQQDAIEALKPAFGDLSGNVVKNVNYYWGADDITKGAYALYGAGQWFTVMPVLRQKFLNTHFAGEHLADWQGFMEGAINSGEEAAEAVMD